MSDPMTRLRNIAEQLFAEGHLRKTDADPLFGEETDRLLLIADAKGNCLRANDAWQKHLGYSTAEMERSTYFSLVHPDDQAATKQAASDLRERPVVNFYNRYRATSNAYKWLSWTASTYDESGLTYAIADVVTEDTTLNELAKLAAERAPREPPNV